MKNKWFNKNSKQKQLDYSDDLIKKCAVYYVPCDLIRPNVMRSRSDFDEDKIISLAYSIKHYGVVEPICIRETDADDSYAYEIITGERRLRAAKLAGLLTIPCIILEIEQQTAAELSIMENLHSEPLNCFEVAFALQRIADNGNDSFDELASRLSISQNELNKKLWLLELEYEERQMILNMDINEDLAIDIARITNKSHRRAILNTALEKNLNSSEIRELIRNPSFCEDKVYDIPRDVASVIKGFFSKVNFLNRRKKRAEMKILHNDGCLIAEIRIKL